MAQRAPILVIHRDLEGKSIAGIQLQRILAELEADRFTILRGSSLKEGRIVAEAHRGLGCILVSGVWPDAGRTAVKEIIELVRAVRNRAPGLPIVLLGESVAYEFATAPAESLGEVRLMYLFEDTVPFLAKQIARETHEYLEHLLPPYFKALVKHATESAYSWHTPGHGGGVAFKKSPVGRAFHEFFGENTLRSDLSVSVPELGSLLDHTGPVAAAEKNAAELFGADHTFFVTNGTSTANKIVWHGTVGRDDLVLVDRNCHKSLLHSIIMTGARPMYFTPSRNHYGIIGPISLDQFSPASIARRIKANPFARKNDSLRIAVVTNSTYDGLCYNAEMIKAQIKDSTDVLHFDEAWYAYAAFHEFYAGRHGMGLKRGYARARHPLIFATHSTHKLLAAFSMASMLHVQNSEQQKLDFHRFNEAFMMHTSTSPQYGIIASIDVAAGMMAGPVGRSLVQETHDEAMSFRRAMANVRTNLKKGDWWFGVWQPDGVTRASRTVTKDWVLAPKAAWHGFGNLAKDYVLLDPIKVTVTTPGMLKGGALATSGIPAAVLSKYLWEHGIVVEKTGLYSFLILFSMGVTKGKWGSLVTALMEFKQMYDGNLPLEVSLPSVAEAGKETYAGMGLRDLCDSLHKCYRDNDLARAMNQMYTVLPEIAMKPADAYDSLVHGNVEHVEIDHLEGRIPAVMLVPYPPGIPLIMPGERFTKATRSIVEYLHFARDYDRLFPGFESDIHGLSFQPTPEGKRYMIDCVRA
jgi:arginine decarboxylase